MRHNEDCDQRRWATAAGGWGPCGGKRPPRGGCSIRAWKGNRTVVPSIPAACIQPGQPRTPLASSGWKEKPPHGRLCARRPWRAAGPGGQTPAFILCGAPSRRAEGSRPAADFWGLTEACWMRQRARYGGRREDGRGAQGVRKGGCSCASPAAAHTHRPTARRRARRRDQGPFACALAAKQPRQAARRCGGAAAAATHL